MSLKFPAWMGILNLTPDSFSDGGQYQNAEVALKQAQKLVQNGATIIDVGGVSTRPGAPFVEVAVEKSRLFDVLFHLKQKLPTHILVSLDTFRPEIALAAARENLVDIINDVCAAKEIYFDGKQIWDTAKVAAKYNCKIIMMHMQGNPQKMQDAPFYSDCIKEVGEFLSERILYARDCGVSDIWVDPGIGFGKRFQDNVDLLSEKGLKALCSLGVPVVIGLSRKRFLAQMFNELSNSVPKDRDAASKLLEKRAIQFGASVIRTHVMPPDNERDS